MMTSSSGYSGGSTPTHQTASTSAGLSLASLKWQVEHDAFLSDFVERQQLPHLALITKGQHLSIGAPNVANPHLKPYVVVHSVQTTLKVIGQLIRIKDNGKKLVTTTQRISIPECYSGFFEILSEDGKPVKCIETVAELSKKFPELCLVRQPCKAYLPDHDHGELRNLYKSRTLREGELLTLVGQFNFKNMQFLRCFDEQGQSVYLKMTSKGKFSPIASKKESITGVHTMKALLQKRLPLTVRLIQGSRGASAASDLWRAISAGGNSPAINASSGPFSGAANVDKNFVIRLQKVYDEKFVFVHSLQSSSASPLDAFQAGVSVGALQSLFMLLPISAHLKLAPALNHSQFTSAQSVAADEFRELCDYCDTALSFMLDKMHAYVEEEVTPVVASSVDVEVDKLKDEDRDSALGRPPSVCDEEIDQLYDFIRGLVPLPDGRERPESPPPPRQLPPPPPPVATIPSGAGGGGRPFGQLTSPVQQPRTSLRSPQPAIPAVPEHRLDAIVYGSNGVKSGDQPEVVRRRLYQQAPSKSVERIAQRDQHANLPAPITTVAYASGNDLRSRRLRPMSMVLPDNVAIVTDPYASNGAGFGAAGESRYGAQHHMGTPATANARFSYLHHQPQQQQLCRSFLDLSIAEENVGFEPVPAAQVRPAQPVAPVHFQYSPFVASRPFAPVRGVGRPAPHFYPQQPTSRYPGYQRPAYRV